MGFIEREDMMVKGIAGYAEIVVFRLLYACSSLLQIMKFRSDLRMSMVKMNRKNHNYKRAHALLSQEIQLVIDDVMEGLVLVNCYNA